MGAFGSIYVRHGFGTLYRPTSAPPSNVTRESVNTPYDTKLTSGTGSAQCNIEYRAQRTIAAFRSALATYEEANVWPGYAQSVVDLEVEESLTFGEEDGEELAKDAGPFASPMFESGYPHSGPPF